MNEQLQKRVKELLYEFGCKVDQNLSNLSDEKLYGYSQMLTDRLILVCKLVRLNLKNWKEACEYVSNLSYGEVQAALQLSDDDLAQKFKIDQCNNDSVGNLSHNEVQEELQLSDDNFVQKIEVGQHNNGNGNGNSNSKRKRKMGL